MPVAERVELHLAGDAQVGLVVLLRGGHEEDAHLALGHLVGAHQVLAFAADADGVGLGVDAAVGLLQASADLAGDLHLLGPTQRDYIVVHEHVSIEDGAIPNLLDDGAAPMDMLSVAIRTGRSGYSRPRSEGPWRRGTRGRHGLKAYEDGVQAILRQPQSARSGVLMGKNSWRVRVAL